MRRCSYCEYEVVWAEELPDKSILCAACKPCLFFERYLTLTGDFSGQPFILLPWMRESLRTVFGTLDDDGMRQYRDVYEEVPTSNSKTTKSAGLVLYFLCTGGIGTEVYSAATAKDQAGITFRMAQQMVLGHPRLRSTLDVIASLKRIQKKDDPTSFYAALSADGDIHDGINPSFVVRDELHRWRTRKQLELNDVLERKVLKRKNPLIWDITTAGDQDESPLCWRRHEYARQIQDGVFKDERFYGRIFAADARRIEMEPEYWKSREARVQANPSHEERGGFLKDSVLLDLCIKAQNDPQVRSSYLRFNLNYWGQTDEAVIELHKWVQCGGDVDLRSWSKFDADRLIKDWKLAGRPCYGGVDCSWTTDLTAFTLVFVPNKLDPKAWGPDDPWIFLPFFWMPRERIIAAERKDKVPYSQWVEKGFITGLPGNAIDVSFIQNRIRWAHGLFDLREVPFDPWNFRGSAQELIRENIECVEVPQNYSKLSEPTKNLLAWYQDRKIKHGNHPVFSWNARCLALQEDDKDNVQPTKPKRTKSSKRIDGISAAITALSRAILSVPFESGKIEVW